MADDSLLRRAGGRAVLALIASVSIAFAANAAGQSDSSVQRVRVDQSSALVQLNGDPLSSYAKTKPVPGKKIDFNANTVKSYRAQLSALRNDFKRWLRANAPAAKVTGEFDIALNAVAVQLNGESLGKIAAAPMVQRAEYAGVYYPTVEDPDLAIIKAIDAWNAAGGSATAGEGVKVAVVDSGIDAGHPCFSDAGYPAQTQLGDRRFTNNKVIAARVFSNRTPSLGYTAEAIDSHGTHVAGTVGCNFDTPATVSGVTIPYGISGVAPRALLGNYNVFPGTTGSARSEDIMNALEAAYTDGFDVVNMSLGGGAQGIQDLLTIAVDNLDQANMVVAVAAGNTGPGHFTIESPGSAARALTAGATTVPHFIGAPVTVAGTTYGSVSGDFAVVTDDLTAPLGVVLSNGNIGTACSALPANSLTGQIALIARGTCTFSVKIRNAQGAGAIAVLVANNAPGDPIPMGTDGTPDQPTVPAYMVSVETGAALKPLSGSATTIGATMAYFQTTNADFQGSFSSQGPTDVDFRVKPDVMAPGVAVLSSFPRSFCKGDPCFAFLQGTSMATPHLAGSAAIVRQQHPTWSAAEIRSAVVNTADQGVVKAFNTGAIVTDPNVIGAGRENLLAAVNAGVALDPVSVSFGAVPAGSGQTRSATLSVRNVSGGPLTLSLAVVGAPSGVAFSVAPASVTIASGESAQVAVTMAAQRGASLGDKSAKLAISSGGAEIAHAVLYTFVK